MATRKSTSSTPAARTGKSERATAADTVAKQRAIQQKIDSKSSRSGKSGGSLAGKKPV